MNLWFVLVLLVIPVTALLLGPLIGRARKAPARREHAIAVHRRQLVELAEEEARNLIGGEEAATARLEIERRLLRAAEGEEGPGDPGEGARMPAIVAVLSLPLAAIAVYAVLGSPDRPGAPWVGGEAPAAEAPLPQEILTLQARMAARPDDVEGWRVLGRALLANGRPTAAADAFHKALQREPEDAATESDLGEALTLAADGTVRPAARAAFEAALVRDSELSKPRYYLALAEWQQGRPQAAFDGWLALAKTAPADAPWIDLLLIRLARAARELAIPLEGELPPVFLARLRGHEKARAGGPPAMPPAARGAPPGAPDPSLVEGMTAGERTEFIESMVARLAERLEREPDDYEGWMRLGRSYGVLGKAGKSAEAYGRATALRPDDPAPLVARARGLMSAVGEKAPPPARAIADFRRVLELDPGHGEAIWVVGLAEARGGRPREAVALWERLLAKIDPELPQHKLLAAEIERAKTALEK